MTQSTYFWNRNSNCEICSSWLLLSVSCWMNMSTSKMFAEINNDATAIVCCNELTKIPLGSSKDILWNVLPSINKNNHYWNRSYTICNICIIPKCKLFINSRKHHFGKSCQKFVATRQLEIFHIVCNLVCVENLYKKHFSYLHGPNLFIIGDHP